MDVQIHSCDFPLTGALRRFTQRRLIGITERFGATIGSMRVHFRDINGPKGGVDKSVRVQIFVPSRRPIVIETRHEDLYAAITITARRLSRAVQRSKDRLREISRSDAPRYSGVLE